MAYEQTSLTAVSVELPGPGRDEHVRLSLALADEKKHSTPPQFELRAQRGSVHLLRKEPAKRPAPLKVLEVLCFHRLCLVLTILKG